MKTLLFATIAAVAFINANANAINSEKVTQRVTYVEIAQTIERDENNNTALMSAAAYGTIEIVRALIAHGTDVNARGYIGNTALIFAVEEGHTAIVRMLIEAGANPDASNDYGNTARTLAKGYGQREIVELFEAMPVQTSPPLLATAF